MVISWSADWAERPAAHFFSKLLTSDISGQFIERNPIA